MPGNTDWETTIVLQTFIHTVDTSAALAAALAEGATAAPRRRRLTADERAARLADLRERLEAAEARLRAVPSFTTADRLRSIAGDAERHGRRFVSARSKAWAVERLGGSASEEASLIETALEVGMLRRAIARHRAATPPESGGWNWRQGMCRP